MPLAALASAVFLTLAALAEPAPAASDLRNLRWVRAVVVSATPETITVRARSREIVMARDAATEIVAIDPASALAAGAIVEAHFVERRGVRRAVVVIADAGPGELSKRPRTSLRGRVLRIKRSTLSVSSGGKTRALALEQSSRLLDRDGRPIATGRDAIAQSLAPDVDLLVKYEGDAFVLDGVDLSGDDKAIEIRRLR